MHVHVNINTEVLLITLDIIANGLCMNFCHILNCQMLFMDKLPEHYISFLLSIFSALI